MNNKTYSICETAIVITETMTDYFHQRDRQQSPVMVQYEEFRQKYGSADLRGAVIDISEKIDSAYNSIIRVSGGDLPNGDCWDFDFVPAVLDRLAKNSEKNDDTWLKACAQEVLFAAASLYMTDNEITDPSELLTGE